MDEDDRRLFRDAVKDVRPINAPERVRAPTPPRPEPRHSMASEASVLSELLNHAIDPDEVETGEELNWLRPGLQTRILKRLRRGHYSVRAELDLHQMNSEAARRSIDNFLAECLKRRITCVRIIHGKGLRSRSRGPVLKSLTNSLLRRRSEVLAFTSAPIHDGGTGAVYVLLKSG